MFFELKYPGFFLAAALIAVYFAVKYYLSSDGLSKKSRLLLFILKYIFLSMTVLFVFDPESVRTVSEERLEKHLVLFDNSRSMMLNDPADSVSIRRTLPGIATDNSFIVCTFGENSKLLTDTARLNFKEDFTNISGQETTSLIDRLISENNVKSINLVTDGNFSDADNLSLKNNIPLNIIYSSLKSPEPDIYIEDLIYQDDHGDDDSRFMIVAGCRGAAVKGDFKLNIYEKGKLIKSISRKIPEPGSFISVKTELQAVSGDLRETEFVIEPLANEMNTFNNRKTAYQRRPVSSGRILLIADTPSLDMTFLTRLLKKGGYNFTSVYENSVSDSIRSGRFESLLALGSPTSYTDPETVSFMAKFKSKMFFVSSKTDLSKLNRVTDAGINSFRYVPAEGRIIENPSGEGSFLLTRFSAPVLLNGMPEIFYNSVFSPDEAKFRPLMLLSNSSKSKAVYHSVKGAENVIIANFSSFWKISFNDESDNFSRLMFNILDLMSADRSYDRIRISPVKEEFYAGEKIVFKGKIMDAKLEPVENCDAELFVRENSLNTKFAYFNKEYSAEMYIAEPGMYSADIKAVTGGTEEIKKNISFKIVRNDLETRSIGADTVFIRNFTGARNGVMLPLSKAAEFLNEKRDKTEIIKKTVRFNYTRNFYFFILLAAVFLIELAYRKYKDLS